ncbi:hypothetical protein WICANDRAFT_86602 [Wickerhamomyces anomalus NRRL Y-366-8]|uniref:SAP domain-containing protein n=1 Tax=Wickerhamomyces anomalus (strain ATCC 58044 / CBS 1984 / NCYC 433 / NRRL Y-366-8) TaxID=683960 RepID=A0A1E3P8F0_WICAA|nr:uncharacterized protein WICANDRAFT_86602 [Wickerhamomyces anomalus NRRL Y-366-8]ODQ61686.1 hypothetical protein WICANDRAFT_86602 [Wickerhamomyces anomalus NRRL Y-366-8]
MAYSSLKVAELKEELTKRNLPTDGTKPQLIAKLEEDDSKKSSEGAATEEPIAGEEEPKQEELLEEEGGDAEQKQEETETPATESKKEDELTPEERKATAIEFLNKKIQRAKKFGTEEDVEEIKKSLQRVEKFGVELGTSLAREIGLTSKENLDGRRRHHNNHRGNRKFRGRGRR